MASTPSTMSSLSSLVDDSNLPQISTMALRNRSRGRDVHIYDAKDRDTVLGGLILINGVTNTNFYMMLEPGNYYINAADRFSVNNEPWLLRTISLNTGTRAQSFCDAVRSRDRRCLISGEKAVAAHLDNWTGFEAAHIFPLAYEGDWIRHNYDRWITIQPERRGTINSIQNGMLLESAVHQLFDSYDLSINPNDNYKIVFFSPDGKGLAGKHLDQEFLDDPQRPVDQLLRWHFTQAVLANIRGAGEPRFEHDFPPGSDIVGNILSGPKAAERMEFELFSRLTGQVEIQNISSIMQE